MTTDSSTEQTLDVASVLSFLQERVGGPLSLASLARELELPEADGETRLEPLVSSLVDEGLLIRTREGHVGCPRRMNLAVGRLSVHPDGFGFVAQGNDQPDLYISGANLGEAMHGDRVVARPEHRRRSGRVEGRVIRVLDRARTQLVGKLERSGQSGWVAPLDRRFLKDVHVPEVGNAADGQIVSVELTAYPSGSRGPEGRIVDVLGDSGDARIDADIVIREYDLAHTFSDEVLAAAERVPAVVTEADIEGRTDFREIPIVTIDGESAKDFDDAVFVELTPNGLYRLHVHIADVAHYVAGDSEIDAEARARATSVYFPGRVLPMLPETLSNGICSLKPGVDRLVHSAVIDIDRQGRTVNYEFHDGVIHSAARLTYRQVAGVIAAGDDAPIDDELAPHRRQLERMRDLAEVLMEHRRGRGSIDFDLPEPEVVINLRGETEDIVKSERNIAHRIVEEFMIRANEVVASHLTWEADAALFRVHDGPDPAKVENFREFISGLGHTLGGARAPVPGNFMDLVEQLEGRPEERVVVTLMLRTMKQARYQVENEGHFGLASQRYTHFTSPIRRYPDLVVHRLLKAERGSDKMAPVDVAAMSADLHAIAAHCSAQERVAEEAEREYTGWKKVQFMADKLGEVYEGHITGVRSFGIFVELEPHFVEGLVAVSSLTDDYYRYDEPKHALRGENTGRALALGDRVKVRVAKVDLERRRLDFGLEEGPLELPAPPREQRRSRRGRRSSRGRQSGRGRRGKRTPAEETAEPVAAQTEDSAAPDSARVSDDQKPTRPRRRRGRRGGRRRGGSSAGREGVEQTDAPEQAAQESRANASEAKTESAGESKASRAGSRRKSPRRERRNDRGRGGDRGRNDRGRNDRGRRSGGVEVKAAPSPVGQPARKPESDRPNVNPYLTDIDY